MNPLFAGLGTTIFETMSALARAHQAINLGQGFPDFGWPETVLDKAAEAIKSGWNQYPPMPGLSELRSAVARHYSQWQNLLLDESNIIITSGATEALAAAIMASVSPGDEVLLFEPCYDSYLPIVQQAGGIARFVRLSPPNWQIHEETLAQAITPNTRVMILNTPHNPTAAVLNEDSLRLIADICIRHDITLISDEVWEHIVFDGRAHLSPMALADMYERTIKIGSAGKIFSLTGWKVGWMCAAPEKIGALARVHQFLTFTTPPALQTAAAFGLSLPESYFHSMQQRLAQARDKMASGLQQAGYVTLPAEGTYFLSVDLKASGITRTDTEFCQRAVREASVAAIPVSAFYTQDPVQHIIRLCFAKNDQTIDEGLNRLADARKLLR